jgi:uncharacterized protein YbjT (DUF2867 family)
MIIVSGATGSIGSHLVRLLAAARVPVRALVRDPARLPSPGPTVDVVVADLDRPDTLRAATAGGERLFLLSPGPDVPAQDRAQIEAARAAGIRHVVMVSSLGAELGGIAGGGPHLAGEALLRESGLAWTILHPSEFMSNTLWWRPTIEAAGAIFAPSGTGRVGFIDPADIAEVAAAALCGDGHESVVHRLTGPAALTTADIAAAIAESIGRPVRHVDIPDQAFRAASLQAGVPAPVVEMLSIYYEAVRAGRVDVVTDDVTRLLGRPATSYADWLARNAASFRAAA